MKVRCTYCGAEFEVPDTVRTTTCPYCGLTLTIKSPEEVQPAEVDHYYFPVAPKDPFLSLMEFVSREYGAPEDIEAASTLEKRELHYIPVYFFHVRGCMRVANFEGNSAHATEVLFYPIVALRKGRLVEVLRGYSFAVRGRRFFDVSVKKKGVYHEPEFDRAYAQRIVEAALMSALRDEARACVPDYTIEESVKSVEFRGLVHYPIWRLVYRYRWRRYEAFVDGADGRIILAEYPQTLAARAACFGLAFLLLAIGLPLSIAIGLLIKAPLATITGAIASVAGAVPPLKRALHVKARGSEVMELEKGQPKPFEALTKYIRVRKL